MPFCHLYLVLPGFDAAFSPVLACTPGFAPTSGDGAVGQRRFVCRDAHHSLLHRAGCHKAQHQNLRVGGGYPSRTSEQRQPWAMPGNTRLSKFPSHPAASPPHLLGLPHAVRPCLRLQVQLRVPICNPGCSGAAGLSAGTAVGRQVGQPAAAASSCAHSPALSAQPSSTRQLRRAVNGRWRQTDERFSPVSYMMTVSAACRLRPTPPARMDSRNTNAPPSAPATVTNSRESA